MRAVVKVKQSQGRTPSNATRYIAGSKLDQEREGDKSRPLFTNKGHDDLTYRKAETFLTGGNGAPIRNDLIHFSVSFRNEDFEALGSNDEERKELLREAAREAMDEFRSDLRVGDWRWVAGIHLNTPHPHIHFLVFKEMATSKGKPRRLGRIPKRLLPYKEQSPDGAVAAVEGKLGGRFVAALDRAQQRVATERERSEREVEDMVRILLSNTLEFDSPLVHQGIEYRTVENFYQAMKTPKDDLETRRKIAAASPEEARVLGERLQARSDWPEIQLQVLETALRHKFAPATRWHSKLRATGDTDILDGSKENHLGNLLMRLRDSREKVITSDEILLEANRRNPSIAGRELVQELILRGPAPEPVNPPEALGDVREALKDRREDDPYYNSQPEKADWLGQHSQELRDIYERGAAIKDDVLIIPAEGHELNNLTADRAPFINERRYVHQEITDPEKADEFYNLAKTIAGKTANTKAEIEYFRYFYSRIKHDGEGRYIKPDQKDAREEALEQTIVEMRELAGEMEKLETIVSIEARRPNAVASLEQVREAEVKTSHDDEDEDLERLAEAEGLAPDLESEGDDEETIPKSEREDEPEVEIDAFIFNTAARKVSLNDERLRFPAGLTFEDRKSLIEIYLPNVDAKIDAGKRDVAILGDINRMVEDWKQKLAEAGTARQSLSDKYDTVGNFLKTYVKERLKDPETRALNASETFRDAHERVTESRSPEKLNRAAKAILKGNDFNWRERALIFFGRSPEHHTPEMRELRHAWGFTRTERAEYAKALGEERRAPSAVLETTLAELESRTTARAISHYRASIINGEMRNPGKLDLRAMYERLPGYERDHLFGKIKEREESLASRHPSLRESAPEIDVSRPPSVQAPRPGESYREYTSALADIERRLIDETARQRQAGDKIGSEITQADGMLTREDRLDIRTVASGLAWERLEPGRIFTNDPAVMELLSLDSAVARLRDETQPRAREAAQRLDVFIRSRGLDQAAEGKTDYYYRADQISRSEMWKLTPADQREFASLEAHAGATLAELKDGFKTIDKLRLEIEESRDSANGSNVGGRHTTAQITDRAASATQNNSQQERVSKLDREHMNDRRILGDLIIRHALADCAAFDYEMAREHGHTFRFNVRDESMEANRRISNLDVHRRAGARGERAADEYGTARKEDRLAIRGQVSEADVRRHSPTLDEHGKKLDTLIGELGSKAKTALDSYRHVQRLAGEVIEKYQNRGETLPTPFANREDLIKAQDEAIKRRFAGHTEKLERLRVTLAEEHGQPIRSDREAARLAAQVFTAGVELKAREERARRFDETRHLRQWEIGGEKFSVADIDRRAERLKDAAAVFGRYELHIDPAARRQAGAEIERIGQIRKEIIEKTDAQRGEMSERVDEAGKLLETLSRAYAREATLREQSGLAMPAPQLTREELERAADNIETVRDANLLRQLSVFERQFNTYADQKERFNPAEGWGRAPARAAVAEIFHRESNERLAAFERRGEVQPLLIETADGRLITHRLEDTRPKSFIEQIARPLVETPTQRELRHSVEQAFAKYENRLRADFEQTSSYLQAAREIVSAQTVERTLRAGHELPALEPAMTPKQVMTIEIYAERQADPKEREHLLDLARGSALSHFDSHSRPDLPEPHAARESAPAIERGR
jgi:predicted NAD-dependent protein-ADP-ribosyltransferase YbiA (DUF1768 family)